MYPNANIWLTGHSLGGGLAALMGTTFGAPVVAFEAPAERLATQRLHLPRPVRLSTLRSDSSLTFQLALNKPHHACLQHG